MGSASPDLSVAAPISARPVVLLIEDEPQIRRFSTRPGWPGVPADRGRTGEEGLVAAATRQPEIIILDLGLPDMDGLDIIRRVREWSAIPIIILSARGQERDKIIALDAGADDYVASLSGSGNSWRACGSLCVTRLVESANRASRSSLSVTCR